MDARKMSLEEIIAAFEPAKINRKAAQFDSTKCNWLNWQYLAALSLDEFTDAALPYIDRAQIPYGHARRLRPVLALIKDKIKQLPETRNWSASISSPKIFRSNPMLRKSSTTRRARPSSTRCGAFTPRSNDWNAAANSKRRSRNWPQRRGVKAV
jgi:glutamyl/glutaminyl-tRNA synthetase